MCVPPFSKTWSIKLGFSLSLAEQDNLCLRYSAITRQTWDKKTCKLEDFKVLDHTIMEKVPRLTAFSIAGLSSIPFGLGGVIEGWVKKWVNAKIAEKWPGFVEDEIEPKLDKTVAEEEEALDLPCPQCKAGQSITPRLEACPHTMCMVLNLLTQCPLRPFCGPFAALLRPFCRPDRQPHHRERVC